MPLKHPDAPAAPSNDLSVQTVFTLEGDNIPRHELREHELPPEVAYQIIHDELMLDGNARMNLATFVSTWMEPQAERLMAECLDKNMIDKDEYPQTAELEMRCVNILSRLWHAPDAGEAVGCSTTGSSEAAMLGGLALKRLWQHRRKAEGKPADRPNLVMGINVQVCWEKFANYWDVEMRLVPMEGDRFHLSAEEAVKLCDENTIGVVAILGSTFDGSYEPVQEICAALDDLQERTGLDVPVHVDGASGAFVAPFADPDLVWDFRLPRVASINASGHKYGLVYPGVGWIVWRDAAALPEDLIFWVNYLGDNMPTFALNFSRPGAQVVAQYYNFLRLGFDGYRKVQLYSRSVAMLLAADRGDRAVRADHPGRRAAGVRVQAQGRGRQLHRLRRLELAARARLAAAGVHVPGQPDRPRGAARRRQARLHARHGRPAREGHRAAAAAPEGAARPGARRLQLERVPPLRRRAQIVVDRRAVHGRLGVLRARRAARLRRRSSAPGPTASRTSSARSSSRAPAALQYVDVVTHAGRSQSAAPLSRGSRAERDWWRRRSSSSARSSSTSAPSARGRDARRGSREPLVWRPDALGSVCFLVASWLAYAAAGPRRLSWRPHDLGWTIAMLNLVGSVFFGLSAIGAYVVPSTAGAPQRATSRTAARSSARSASSSAPGCCSRGRTGSARPDAGPLPELRALEPVERGLDEPRQRARL